MRTLLDENEQPRTLGPHQIRILASRIAVLFPQPPGLPFPRSPRTPHAHVGSPSVRAMGFLLVTPREAIVAELGRRRGVRLVPPGL